jgi:hypothetical protein
MGATRSYPRAVKRASFSAHRVSRVYDGSLRAILLALLVLGPGVARTQAQVELTVNQSMVKGPRNAPVTIIEFSDYQ